MKSQFKGMVYAVVVFFGAIVLLSNLTAHFIEHSAANVVVFVCYQVIIVGMIGVICAGMFAACLGQLWSPGHLIRELSKTDWKVRSTITKIDEHKGEASYQMQFGLLCEAAYPALYRMRKLSLLVFGANLACIVVLLSMSTIFASAYFGPGKAFTGLSADDSVLHHGYYVLGTMVTIGYGEVHAAGTYGYIFVATMAALSIYLVMIGLAYTVSHFYYLVHRLESDLELLLH